MFIFGQILSTLERLTKAIEANNQNNFEILRLLRKEQKPKTAAPDIDRGLQFTIDRLTTELDESLRVIRIVNDKMHDRELAGFFPFKVVSALDRLSQVNRSRSTVHDFDDSDGQPSMKVILEMLEHDPDCGIPGVLFPIDHSAIHGEFRSEDGRVFISRSDQSGIFASDVDAANFVACIIGKPWKKFYDQPPEKYFFPYFELTLDEVKYIHEQFKKMVKDMPWWE